MVARTISARRSGATPRLGLMPVLSWLDDQLSLSTATPSSAACRVGPGPVALAVNGHEFVRGRRHSSDGCLAMKRSMATVPIVVVQPRGQRLSSLSRRQVRPPVRPLAQQGLNEALGFAV